MTMRWQRAEDVIPEWGAMYLVKTNAGEWRDNDLYFWPAPLLERAMKPEIVRGRPIWVAKVTDPISRSAP